MARFLYTLVITTGTRSVQIIPQLYSEKKPKTDHMLEEDIFNVLIGTVMNDSSSGSIKVLEDILQETVFIILHVQRSCKVYGPFTLGDHSLSLTV